MLDRQQAQIGIRGERRMVVDFERNHRIVLGLHQQRGTRMRSRN